MCKKCEDCAYSRVIAAVQRGYMDWDPPEYYCAKGSEYFDADEDDEEITECEYFKDTYVWTL